MQSTHRNNGSPEAATSNEPIRESSSMAVDHSNGGAVNDDPFPAFPAEYKKQQRWCLWKYELKDGKLTKVPYRNLAQRSSHSDPARWISYDIAVSNYRCYASGEQPTPEGRVAGIGIFNNSDFTSIDLDKCRDQNTGELEPWAEKLVQEIGSYAEYSPSGSGVHIFTRGTVKKSAKMNGCEIYSQQRFFTVTGKPLPKAPAQVSEYPKLAELRENIAGNRLRPYQLENASDGQTVPAPSSGGLVLVAKAPADFDRLWAGDPVYISERYNGDERAADQGLANLLASRLNGNFAAVEAAFTESALGQREKWRGREDYRERTINKAIADWQKYQPSRPEVDPDNWRGLFHSHDQIMNARPSLSPLMDSCKRIP